MELDIMALETQPQTPATSEMVASLRDTEDSGYHTPFTPSLSDSGALNTSTARRIIRRNTNSAFRKRLVRSTAVSSFGSNEEDNESGVSQVQSFFYISPGQEDSSQYSMRRRPLKRSLEQSEERVQSMGVASTPTSAIAGDLERLHVHSPTPVRVASDVMTSDYFSLSSIGESSKPLSYPTTPVKSSRCKIAKLSPTKKSPSKEWKENIHPKRSVKKLSYECTHTTKEPPKCELKPRPLIVPNKKLDIIGKLYEMQVHPAIPIILGYLNGADLYNFSKVCQMWWSICNSNKRAMGLRDSYASYVRATKENCHATNRVERESQDGEKFKLRCIHNFIKSSQAPSGSVRTPPGTPRTNKLRKFYKCASLDGRMQLSCVRCCQPAKVTEEQTGEQWAQCLSDTCSFAFCRFCKCERHPEKTCRSLDAPSPTKRRKQSSEKHFDSKKCRRNLRRLMER